MNTNSHIEEQDHDDEVNALIQLVPKVKLFLVDRYN